MSVLLALFEETTPKRLIEARAQVTHIPNCQGLRSVGRKHPLTLVIAARVAMADKAREDDAGEYRISPAERRERIQLKRG